ncbi:MAG: IclR family transcriptional regulator [Firmicutes bacterium]|nr:IclR family transcriptional regulator [Bacillota bacterium]
MTAKKNTGYNAPVLYRAFDILEEIARTPSELGTSDLARKLTIPKSTVYGIVQALMDIGALRQNKKTNKFFLGPTLVRLGNQALAGINIRSTARPYMDKLSEEHKVTVFMGVFDEHGITIVERADSPLELKITAPIGARIPIFAGASGKVFLAGMRKNMLDKILKERSIPKFTENSITDPEQYYRELDKVRQEGFANDFEEYIQGVNAVSVPLLADSWGWPAAALWLVGFSHTFNGEKLKQAVTASLKAAKEIEKILERTAIKSSH